MFMTLEENEVCFCHFVSTVCYCSRVFVPFQFKSGFFQVQSRGLSSGRLTHRDRNTHTHTYTDTHTCTHTPTDTYTQHTQRDVQTHIRTRTHTHLHTHTRTQIRRAHV